MWSFFWKEKHPNRRKSKLTRSNCVRPGPDDAMQGGPALKYGGESVVNKKVCQDSNPPHRVPNKLRKEHRHTHSSASSRLRFVCSRQSSDSSQSRATATTHTSPLNSWNKIRPTNIESQSEPNTKIKNALTTHPTLKPPKLPESMESRGRTSKLQKRYGHDNTYKGSQKVRQEEHIRESTGNSIYRNDKNSLMGTVVAASSGARLKKRQRTRSEVKCHPRASSLPSQNTNETPRSSTSDTSEIVNAYMLSGLDALSARPTLKCASKPRYVPPNTYVPSYTENIERMRGKIRIPEEDIMSNKKVAHIADRLSAHELRELMERDQKRREKREVTEVVPTDRGSHTRVKGQIVNKNLGTQKPEDFVEKNILRQERSEVRVKKRASYPLKSESVNKKSSSPIKYYPVSVEPVEVALTSTSEYTEPIVQKKSIKKARRSNTSQCLASRLSTSSSTAIIPTDKENDLKDKPPQSWTSFFKTRNKNKRASVPQSFFTTSCDSLPSGKNSRSCYTSMRSTSSIPRRTISKFREDLPEFPVSSPSLGKLSSDSPDLQGTSFMPVAQQPSSDPIHNYSHGISISQSKPIDIKNQYNESFSDDHLTDDAYQFHNLSQSLASIDSEASWLSSGRGCVRGNSKKSQKKTRTNSASQNKFYQDHLESQKHRCKREISEDDNLSRGNIFNKYFQAESPKEWGEDSVNEVSELTKWGEVARRPHITHRSSVSGNSGRVLLNDAEVDSISMDISMVTSQESSSGHLLLESTSPRGRFATTLNSGNQHSEYLNNIEAHDLINSEL